MLSVSENDSRQLVLINEALERLGDDEYGYCQNCEEEIITKKEEHFSVCQYCGHKKPRPKTR